MVSLAGEVNLIDHEGKEYAQSVPHEKSQEERSHSAIQVDTSDSQDDRLDRPSAKDREDRVDGVRRRHHHTDRGEGPPGQPVSGDADERKCDDTTEQKKVTFWLPLLLTLERFDEPVIRPRRIPREREVVEIV